jgi:hypothetical protein
LFQKKLKNSSKHMSNFRPHTFSFLGYFEWFKTWWVHQLRLYKNSLCSKGKDVIIKDIKFHPSPNIKTFYIKHPISRWKSFKVYHIGWKGPSLYILIHIKNMNQKLSKILEGLYLDYYNFRFHHNHSYMCFYMVKKD